MASKISITAEIKHTIQDAMLLSDGTIEAWVPKSLCLKTRLIDRDSDTWEFMIPEWIAEEKEFI